MGDGGHFDAVRMVVATVLEVDPEEVTGETCAATLPAWDSLAHMMIINAIERRFAIKLPKLTAYTVKNVAELAAAVGDGLKAGG